MSDEVLFEVDTENALRLLRIAPAEIKRALRSELNRTARMWAVAARAKLPSGAKKASTGIVYRGSTDKGFVVQAKGSADESGPKGWTSALEAGPLRHPVFPKKGMPRKKWTWRPLEGSQPPFHMIERTRDEDREALGIRLDRIIRQAFIAAGFDVIED